MTHVIYSLLRRSLAGSQRTAEPKPKYRKAFFIFFHRVHPRASKGHAGNRAMHSRIIGWPAYPAFVSLRHFFEACGDELIDAFSRLRGLFGDAAMKLRRDAQRGRPGIRLFRFGATLFAPLPIIGDRVRESLARFLDRSACEMQGCAPIQNYAAQ